MFHGKLRLIIDDFITRLSERETEIYATRRECDEKTTNATLLQRDVDRLMESRTEISGIV